MPLGRIVVWLVILAVACWMAVAIASALSLGPPGMLVALPLAAGGIGLWQFVAARRIRRGNDGADAGE